MTLAWVKMYKMLGKEEKRGSQSHLWRGSINKSEKEKSWTWFAFFFLFLGWIDWLLEVRELQERKLDSWVHGQSEFI